MGRESRKQGLSGKDTVPRRKPDVHLDLLDPSGRALPGACWNLAKKCSKASCLPPLVLRIANIRSWNLNGTVALRRSYRIRGEVATLV